MNETEPLYFKEFKKHIDVKIETSFNELAIIIKDTLVTKDDIKDMVTKEDLEYEINEIKREMATKDDIKGIHEHIGRYEVRAQNVEQILLQDHKPRIADLEKEVFI